MLPSNTSYMIADSGQDYKDCHTLMKGTEYESYKLKFPTIMARRDGQLIALLGTSPNKKAIIAEPLIYGDIKNKHIITLRLAEAYERVLLMANISVYLFHVPFKEEGYIKIVKRLFDIEPYDQDDIGYWFRRSLVQ